MLKISTKLSQAQASTAVLSLPYEKRQKSRFKARLDDGREVGLFLPRGEVLRGGDCLLAEDESIILVAAEPETISRVQSDDPLLLAKACYHLGNRHVALQIELNYLSYLHDHVLDEMVEQLGLDVSVIEAAFEPESGAYGGQAGHSHAGHTHTHANNDASKHASKHAHLNSHE